jgi:hypothetical protein
MLLSVLARLTLWVEKFSQKFFGIAMGDASVVRDTTGPDMGSQADAEANYNKMKK